MTPYQYRAIRESIGSQAAVAKLLGVAKSTVERRESGKIPISEEAAMAVVVAAARYQHYPDNAEPVFDSTGSIRCWAVPGKPKTKRTT